MYWVVVLLPTNIKIFLKQLILPILLVTPSLKHSLSSWFVSENAVRIVQKAWKYQRLVYNSLIKRVVRYLKLICSRVCCTFMGWAYSAGTGRLRKMALEYCGFRASSSCPEGTRFHLFVRSVEAQRIASFLPLFQLRVELGERRTTKWTVSNNLGIYEGDEDPEFVDALKSTILTPWYCIINARELL